jgi:hypothetical protein
LFKINELRTDDKRVTGKTGRHALFGAVVEFSTRAGIGFAGD